jgi:diguanylate cyclase (GGDEF)-like protein
MSASLYCRPQHRNTAACTPEVSLKRRLVDSLHTCVRRPQLILALLAALTNVLTDPAGATTAAPAPLDSLRSIANSPRVKAGESVPVSFEAIVTYTRPYEHTLFVQARELGIFVLSEPQWQLAPGDRVRVEGTTQGSFRPVIVPSRVIVLNHGPLPRGVPATYDRLIRGAADSQLVVARGLVRSADYSYSGDQRAVRLRLAMDGGDVEAETDSQDLKKYKALLDSDVEVTGVAGGRFDGKMNQIGVILHVPSEAAMHVLHRSVNDPWSLPLTPLGDILTHSHISDQSTRVHVQGTITYQQVGSALVIQSKDRSLWINTDDNNQYRPGDLADVTGYPDVQNGSLVLDHGDVLDRYWPAPVKPLLVTWQDIAKSQHVFDLVSIEATVLTAVREATQDNFILSADGHLFSAVVRRRAYDQAALAALKTIEPGSTVRVTGVCVPGDSNPYNPNVPFNILMGSADGIAVLARPSPVNQSNLLRAIAALLLLVAAIGAWGWTLRKRVHKQARALARRAEAEADLQRRISTLEQRRRRIIEEINGDVPLSEILEQIAETTALHLGSATCWFEASNGKRYGEKPLKIETMRLLQTPLLSPSGTQLGTISAAFAGKAPLPLDASEALKEGARVGALAIETRRLYADLRHRSDFDQLTDLHNRSYLERQVDLLIDEAQHTGIMFALIYIDLDGFKQINDQYGHHIGDLYLKESTRRMKRQMRGADLLARLGGDEFVALASDIKDRSEVLDIVRRLERCFEADFLLENYLIRGAASFGIALYPEDGITRDLLLRSADAIMYGEKRKKKQPRPAVTIA